MKKLAYLLPFVLCACSGGGASAESTANATFPLDPYASLTSEEGAYHVEVRTSPSQPPQRGELQLEVRVTDANGGAADGLALDVVPWMPAMGHGTSVTPDVTSDGSGTYRVGHVDLFMPGTWQVRLMLGSDHLTVPITVQ